MLSIVLLNQGVLICYDFYIVVRHITARAEMLRVYDAVNDSHNECGQEKKKEKEKKKCLFKLKTFDITMSTYIS